MSPHLRRSPPHHLDKARVLYQHYDDVVQLVLALSLSFLPSSSPRRRLASSLRHRHAQNTDNDYIDGSCQRQVRLLLRPEEPRMRATKAYFSGLFGTARWIAWEMKPHNNFVGIYRFCFPKFSSQMSYRRGRSYFIVWKIFQRSETSSSSSWDKLRFDSISGKHNVYHLLRSVKLLLPLMRAASAPEANTSANSID